MIKINLAGNTRKKPAQVATKIAPMSLTSLISIVIALGSVGGGYWWYMDLAGRSKDLDTKIRDAEAEKARLEAVIKADQVYETRKKILEARVKVIEGLQKNQASPVLALDQLAEAVERTQFVWLQSLEQKDTILSMNGMGTSLNAIADFYTNLNATGYFKNVDLGPSQESGTNFTFTLRCEFSPPRPASSNPQAEITGGN